MVRSGFEIQRRMGSGSEKIVSDPQHCEMLSEKLPDLFVANEESMFT
jgi:hypothetical protein